MSPGLTERISDGASLLAETPSAPIVNTVTIHLWGKDQLTVDQKKQNQLCWVFSLKHVETSILDNLQQLRIRYGSG